MSGPLPQSAPQSAPGLPAHVARALDRSGLRIILTGASGWLGMATLELLEAALGGAFPARIACFGGAARGLALRSGSIVEQRPLAELGRLERAPSLLLHCAFLTRDRAELMPEAAYRAANLAIRDTVMSALEPVGVAAVFVPSSGAAALADDDAAPPARRLYGALKREDERAYADWANANGKRAVIARLFNLSGPCINKTGHYALASFINACLAGAPIRINAGHGVERGYVAVREVMALVLSVLLHGGGVTRLESGGEPIELGALARLVSATLGPVPIVRAPANAAPVDRYLGDNAAYQALLAAHAIPPVPLPVQIAETAAWLALNPHAQSGCAA